MPARRNPRAARIQQALVCALCALYITGCTSSEEDEISTTENQESTSATEEPAARRDAAAEAPSPSTSEPDSDTTDVLRGDDSDATVLPDGEETTASSTSSVPEETDGTGGGSATDTKDAGAVCEFGTFEYHAWRYDDEGDCFVGTFEYFSGCARDRDPQEDGYLVCAEAIGYAIAPDGTCWSFPNLCFPVGWTDISSSLDAPEIEHPCRGREIDGEGSRCGSFVPDASAPDPDASVDGGG